MNDNSTKATTRIEQPILPPKPLAYLIVWGQRGERRDVRLSKREADDVARVMKGQVIPLVEIRP